jgi:glycosyltransferase involved in cell wall biosynthesis
MNKVSFVTTVLNEAGSIGALLDSLEGQSRKPDEVIIVDGGSTDGTEKIVRKYQERKVLLYRYIRTEGNRAKGRNEGVRQAKYPIVAISDAGCILDDDWLMRITQPFSNPKLDAVAGFYLPVTGSLWQKCFAPFLATMPDKLDTETFLPSSRSLAVRKKSLIKLGGYPEHLDYCEDLVLADKLKKQANMGVKQDAVVLWQLPENLAAFGRTVSNYASGDVKARYRPHLLKIATVFGRYVVFAGLPILFPLYLLIFPNLKHWDYVKKPMGLIYLPITQLVADLEVMKGAIKGIM